MFISSSSLAMTAETVRNGAEPVAKTQYGQLYPKGPLQKDLVTEYVQERTHHQPENPFASLIPDQTIAIIPSFTLESGETLHNVPLAYSTRGRLSPNRDNAMVICHALTGSADVSDWWGPLLGGPGRAFDISRFFVICMNSLGSPYGSASPVTCKDGNPNNERYGPEFPLTTIRDDVKYGMHPC
jgi:homoserine O-acetyltransferase